MTTELLKRTLVVLAVSLAGIAYAWTIKDVSADRKDVYCNDGTFVGSMFRNGDRWSDGLRSDPDPAVVAKQMVAAQGSSCI